MVVSGRATRRERTRASSSGASVHGTADRLSRRVGRRLRRRVLLARNWCPGRGCAQPLVWPPFRSETTETRARPWEGRERGRSTVGRAREGPAAACAVGNKRWSTMYEDGRGCAPAAPRLRAARAAGGIGRSGVRRRSLAPLPHNMDVAAQHLLVVRAACVRMLDHLHAARCRHVHPASERGRAEREVPNKSSTSLLAPRCQVPRSAQVCHFITATNRSDIYSLRKVWVGVCVCVKALHARENSVLQYTAMPTSLFFLTII